MALDMAKLVGDMVSAVAPILGKKGDVVGKYAEVECRKLIETIAMIEAAKGAGQIKEAEARLLVEMQKTAMRSVLTTAEGIGLLAAENAINAATAAVRAPINAALGFVLL